jgi:hypothetical protein
MQANEGDYLRVEHVLRTLSPKFDNCAGEVKSLLRFVNEKNEKEFIDALINLIKKK